MNVTAGLGETVLAAKRAEPQIKKLKEASQQIEGLFVKDLLTQMEKGLGKSLFGKTPGAAIYQDMFTQSIADSVSKGGNFGIGKTLEKQFTKDVFKIALGQVRAELSVSGSGLQVADPSQIPQPSVKNPMLDKISNPDAGGLKGPIGR